jgi:hypothetical protein
MVDQSSPWPIPIFTIGVFTIVSNNLNQISIESKQIKVAHWQMLAQNVGVVKAQVTCKLWLITIFWNLVMENGLACENTMTIGLDYQLERFHSFQWIILLAPRPLDLSISTFGTFTHRWQPWNWLLPVRLFVTSFIIWSISGSLQFVGGRGMGLWPNSLWHTLH